MTDLAQYQERLGAICPHGLFEVAPTGSGPLDGMRCAVKDLFDVAGHPTGAGNPDWLRTHGPADRHADAVATILANGARLFGKTITDELAWSLVGANAHYGTPINSRAPDRIPGGSSSGSASAVAGGAADIALGTDTAGSVRIPAAFCGLFGIRTTHGRLSLRGCVPLAPSFDTLGWFARDERGLAAVASAFFGEWQRDSSPLAGRNVVILEDLFALADPEVSERVRRAVAPLASAKPVRIFDGTGDRWLDTFRRLQAKEAWECHGAWIARERPQLGDGVRERFAIAASLAKDDLAAERQIMAEARQRIEDIVGDGVAILPTAPTEPPRRDASAAEMERYRAVTLRFTILAALAGLPQLNIPVGAEGSPVAGLGIIGARNADERLIDIAAAWADPLTRSNS